MHRQALGPPWIVAADAHAIFVVRGGPFDLEEVK